jgi:hypothetical protein
VSIPYKIKGRGYRKFVEVCLTWKIPDTKKVPSWPQKFSNFNFLRAAIALPYKWGRTTAETLIGLGATMSPNYPYFDCEPNEKPYSDKLWKAHIDQKDPVTIANNPFVGFSGLSGLNNIDYREKEVG